jgi:hypothetical protein
MADIAMLVAEESEKRIKRGAAGADEEASKGRNLEGMAKAWGSWAESAAAAASGVKVHVALLVKAEPKTPFTLAAFNGFFSA